MPYEAEMDDVFVYLEINPIPDKDRKNKAD